MARAKKEDKAVMARVDTLPAHLACAEEDAGLGLQNVGTDDQAIPFLKILQDISNEVKERDGSYIDGAVAGMLVNSATRCLFSGKDGVLVIPVAYEAEYLEWRPRDQGGGFQGRHPVTTPLVNECERGPKGENILANGNLLARTAQHYVLLLHENGVFDQLVVAMSGSQLKKSKRWNTMMKSTVLKRRDGTPFVPPSFLFTYRLTSVLESSASGEYYNWSISQEKMLGDAQIYGVAKEFALAIDQGAVKSAAPAGEAEGKTAAATPF